MNIRAINSHILFIGLAAVSAALLSFVFIARPAAALTATGTLESAVYDLGVGTDWKTMAWSASSSGIALVELRVRTGTTTDMAGASAWNACATTTSGTDISAHDCVNDGDRFVQWRADFTSVYATATAFVSAELYSVAIEYDAIGIVVSNPYNTLADDTVVNEVRWSENKPAGTDVLVQLRSSADNTTWSDWMGTDGTTYSYFSDPSGAESAPAALSDGAGDQYLQYRIIFDSGGTELPALTDLTLEFTANVPVIADVSPAYAWSNASGTIMLAIDGSGFDDGSSITVVSGNSEVDCPMESADPGRAACWLDTALLFGGPATVTVTNPNGAWDSDSSFYVNEYRGALDSSVLRAPNLGWGALSWSADESATGTVRLRARSDTRSDMAGAAAWASCPLLTSGNDITGSCVTDGQEYLQWRAEFTAVYGTSSAWISPALNEVGVNYARMATSGLLTSSPYDTGTDANAVRRLSWTASVPANSAVKFQLRTAPDAAAAPGTWTAWAGPAGADWYFTDSGTNAIYLPHTDGTGDRWVQYRVRLESDGLAEPVLGDVTVEYGEKRWSEQRFKDGTIFKGDAIFR